VKHFYFLGKQFFTQVNEKSKRLDQNPITEKRDLENICAELILGKVDYIHQFVGMNTFSSHL
jgi:hypothetical protein